MSSPTKSKTNPHDDKEREARLANLSGAMALARLTHQVKELELQKHQQDELAKPSFTAINCIIDTGVLVSMLESVKRWSGEGGVNIIVPLTVLDELDKSKKGTEAINIKTRDVIRYLDRRIKSRPTRTVEGTPSGSLQIQAPEELYQEWEDCEKLRKESNTDVMSKEEIPRHFRAMINCVLFRRSKGNNCSIMTEDADLGVFAERWDIATITGNELENTSAKALDKYRRDMKAYETRKRTALRNSPPSQRILWTPPK